MRRAHLFLAAATSLAVSGCVAGPAPEIATPTPVLPQSYAMQVSASDTATVEALLPIADPAFTTLATAAWGNAPTILQAAARVESARARAAGSGANRLPQVSADRSITATRTNPAQFGGNLPGGISIDTEQVAFGSNIGLVWDPDIFGRLRAQERSSLSLAEAAGADAAAIKISIIAEIAAAVIDWRTLTAREDALNEDVVAAESLVALADIRERAGIAPGFDRVRAETAAEASRSRIAGLASERARIIGRLVTLTGQSGQLVREVLTPRTPSTDIPTAPASTPSNLLASRPDVQAAAARLAASDADLYAVAANRFPQFTLSAALGLLSFDLGSVFDEDSVVGSASGSLLAPLFDFGRIQAQIDGAAADKRVAFQAYRGAVFKALGEAETAYGLVAAADRELQAASREQASATRAAELADVRFRAGLSSFLTVLDARRVADSSGERAAAAKGRAQRARILLWQALGGVEGRLQSAS